MSPSKSVLVLDDSEDLLELVKLYIERLCGCHAVTAQSMHEVETHADEAFACELAFLDINLGPNEPNGLDVFRWLRANGFDHPIYFLTGHARNNPLVAEAERLGGAKVLSKPIAADELKNVIGSHA